jgi:hypothetical protein
MTPVSLACLPGRRLLAQFTRYGMAGSAAVGVHLAVLAVLVEFAGSPWRGIPEVYQGASAQHESCETGGGGDGPAWPPASRHDVFGHCRNAAKIDAGVESARDQCAAQIPDCVRLRDPLSGNSRAIEGSE